MKKLGKKLLVCMAALMLCVGCAQKSENVNSGEKMTANVGTWKTAQTIQPFFYGEFTKDNVNVKPFTNPGDMKTALLAGDLDFTGTTWVTAIMAASKGEPVKVVASMVEKCSALVVRSDSNIGSVSDLKGKKIAYVPGTMHHILLLETLSKAGLNPDKDVTLVNIDFFDMGQALASKSIDAFLSGEPFPSMAVKDGYGKVLEYPYYDDSIGHINAAMITTEDQIKNNPDKIQKLVDMHKKSTEKLIKDKEAWINKAAEFGTKKEYVETSTGNIELTWDISPKTIGQVKKLAQRMKDLKMIDKVPDVDSMFDLSFLEKAKK